MKALCWRGVGDVAVEEVPEPALINRRDAIVKVSRTTICGSDLHLYNGYVPAMAPGDIMGHEFMGEVVDIGSDINGGLKVGDRVVVPANISCGGCFYCKHELFSCCDNSNPNPEAAQAIWGQSPGGIYGYSHVLGGYAGSHAEYVRVPFADVGPRKLPEEISDDQALFISDAFPTGYMGADFCDISPGDTVAVWGAGAVGLFAMVSARLLGAEQVIALDRLPERLELAQRYAGAEIVDYRKCDDVVEELKALTGGRGPDACIEAVGMEARKDGIEGTYDRVKQALRLETDRPYALRDAILACRKGGVVSILGVYGGVVDKLPLGAAMNKGLTFRMAQLHSQRYLDRLIEHVVDGSVDPSFVVTHRLPLNEAPLGYEMFKHKTDSCVRVVFTP